MATPKEFLDQYGNAIMRSTLDTNLFPSVAIAQAAIETGWGRATIGSAHNLFGIKAGSNWKGKVISMTTQEENKDKSRTTYKGTGKIYNSYSQAVSAGAHPQTFFRYYNSYEDSMKDHTKLLTESKRYAPAMQCTTPEDQITTIIKCGYGTASGYPTLAKNIINQYNLKSYDEKKNIMKYIEIVGAIISFLFAGYVLYKHFSL